MPFTSSFCSTQHSTPAQTQRAQRTRYRSTPHVRSGLLMRGPDKYAWLDGNRAPQCYGQSKGICAWAAHLSGNRPASRFSGYSGRAALGWFYAALPTRWILHTLISPQRKSGPALPKRSDSQRCEGKHTRKRRRTRAHVEQAELVIADCLGGRMWEGR